MCLGTEQIIFVGVRIAICRRACTLWSCQHWTCKIQCFTEHRGAVVQDGHRGCTFCTGSPAAGPAGPVAAAAPAAPPPPCSPAYICASRPACLCVDMARQMMCVHGQRVQVHPCLVCSVCWCTPASSLQLHAWEARTAGSVIMRHTCSFSSISSSRLQRVSWLSSSYMAFAWRNSCCVWMPPCRVDCAWLLSWSASSLLRHARVRRPSTLAILEPLVNFETLTTLREPSVGVHPRARNHSITSVSIPAVVHPRRACIFLDRFNQKHTVRNEHVTFAGEGV